MNKSCDPLQRTTERRNIILNFIQNNGANILNNVISNSNNYGKREDENGKEASGYNGSSENKENNGIFINKFNIGLLNELADKNEKQEIQKGLKISLSPNYNIKKSQFNLFFCCKKFINGINMMYYISDLLLDGEYQKDQ